MKGLSILLLLLASAVQLYSAVPALQAVTCNVDGVAPAARQAMHHINAEHDHGYKFRLLEVSGSKMETVVGGCNIELKLNLGETVCHTVNPKHFEDCEYRGQEAWAVGADCNVTMTVRNSDAKVTKYSCNMRHELTPQEMVMMCPDCPKLLPLTSPEGLMSVNQAVKKFNENATNERQYILQEVGRITSGYIMMAGMFFYAEFVVVETQCPRVSRILPDACSPLCPDRATHAFCRSSYSRSTHQITYDCDFYPPKNTAALGPGEQEPVCTSQQPVRPPGPPGPPPGPPAPPDLPPGPPGIPVPPSLFLPPPPPPPPVSARSKRSLGFNRPALDSYHPLHPNHPCHGPQADPAIHPICPRTPSDQQQSPRA